MLQMLEGVALKQTLWVVERVWAGSSRVRMKGRHQKGGGGSENKATEYTAAPLSHILPDIVTQRCPEVEL